TTLLMVGLLLAGITGYRSLPVAALPQVDYPTIVVATQLPGASADTMASAVTTPLERQFGQMSVLAQKISQVAGVGLVTIGGGQKPAVRVQVDPVALAGTDLTIEDVRTAIAAANVNQPKGNLDGPRQDWALATNDQLGNAA